MEYIIDYIASIDPSVRTLPDLVYIIWQTVLWIVVLVIVPLATFLLHRTLIAAIGIHKYLLNMLAAGVGIAENTSSVVALEDTISVAGSMLAVAANLDEHSGTIATVLATRAKGD